MVSDRLKNIVFKQLYKELSKAEIIFYQDSVYFIDRDKKYWYFEYETISGKLWWRYDFFINFFVIFSLEPYDYEKVMGEWVEEVLNCGVNTTQIVFGYTQTEVEEVLNCGVNTTMMRRCYDYILVEEVLDCKVLTTHQLQPNYIRMVEDILNCKVTSTSKIKLPYVLDMEEVLNCEVNTTQSLPTIGLRKVGEVLNTNT